MKSFGNAFKNTLNYLSILFLLLLCSFLLCSNSVSAHSGGTNSSGCHNDYVNGGYHCHTTGSSSGSSTSGVVSFGGIVLIIYVVFKVVSWINSENSNTNNTNQSQTPRPQTPRPQTPRPQTPRPQVTNSEKYNGDDILINIGVLGMLVSKVDGRLLDREKQIVFNWIKNKTSASFAESKISAINNYVRYISESSFDNTKMKSEINHYLRILKTECSTSMKYEVLMLYIDVIIVDDVLHQKEKAAIYHIAKNIGVDMDKFLELFHDKLPKALLESAIDASTLGILPSMTDLEKKKILREQYRKWADLVTSDDENIRRKAEIMLAVISKERLKLKES